MFKHPVFLLIVASAITATSSLSHAGKIHKWVDSNGVTHYTAQPPQNQPSQTLRVTKSRPQQQTSAQQQLEKTMQQLNARSSDRRLTRTLGKEAAEREKQRRHFCQKAQQQMKILKSNKRIFEKDTDGTKVQIDATTIKVKRAKLSSQMQRHCK